MQLPNIDELELESKKGGSLVNESLEKTEDIVKRLLVNIEAFKKIELDNRNLRRLLLKNQDYLKNEFYNKLKGISDSMEKKQIDAQTKHKSLLKKHEEAVIEFKKNLEIEKKKNLFLRKKSREIFAIAKQFQEENYNLKTINRKLLHQIKEMEKNSLANQEELNKRTLKIKEEFEAKISSIVKGQLNKDVAYRAKIESLSKNLEN